MHPLSTQGDVPYEPVGLMNSFQPSSVSKFASETDNINSAHNPDNRVTANFRPHLWMFLLQTLYVHGTRSAAH
jgi:hypothetical protein